ncbi:hypothetical protein ACEN9J_13730 [Variovorax sp. Varisp41]|uniref:hypothetical protein n=1 Tax=unclassified Variovorax TaxID=663243 RepID=UPI0039B686C9
MHLGKSLAALMINWIVLSSSTSQDYVTWAVTSSILIIATASDLGIGQYATTQFIHSLPENRTEILRLAIVALMPLAVLASLFVYVALKEEIVFYRVTMASLIGCRIISIPFSALLNAVNQYKIRKIIELCVYLAAAVLIATALSLGQNVKFALIILNAAFLVAGIATIVFARKYLPREPQVKLKTSGEPSLFRKIKNLYVKSAPFMVNNLTGLLTYGGFIWISSFMLDTEALAKLSVLHAFVLMNVYQVYEVILKSRQADLINPSYLKKMRRINLAFISIVPVFLVLTGKPILLLVAKNIPYSNLDIVIFSTFISVELAFLFLQSIVQVRSDVSSMLSRYSFIKFSAQGSALFLFWIFSEGKSSALAVYLLIIVAATSAAYLSCHSSFAKANR